MLAEGRRPRALSDWAKAGPPGFTVSFDDAHRSVLEQAAPVLAELGIPATLFVPTGFPDEADWSLTWTELRELAKMPGWTLGSHSHTHQRMVWRLYDEDESAHAKRLSDELELSKRLLLERAGVRADLFAYPFGEADPIAKAVVQECGFLAGFTVSLSEIEAPDPFGIPRIDVGPGPSIPDQTPGITVVIPAFDRVQILDEVLRRLEQQTYPAERFEILVIEDGDQIEPGFWAERSEAVRHLRLPGSDERFQAGQARQLGADEARFELLAFLDADVAVDRDFLWSLQWAHRQDSNAVILGYISGYNLHELGYTHQREHVHQVERLDGRTAPIIPDRSREPAARSVLDQIQWLEEPWQLAYTGNISLSKSLLRRAGGFSSQFRGWGFEDVDLGVRLHGAGAAWVFSRFSIGYHLADPGDPPPRNPFRKSRPVTADFDGVRANLGHLAQAHADHPGVQRFCTSVLADVDETLSRPTVVGVEMGAPYPVPWPFTRRLHQRHPGGRPIPEIADRFAYAAKVGAQDLYLLGGDVALRPDVEELLLLARKHVHGRITLESTGAPFAREDLAEKLQPILDGVAIEVLVGHRIADADAGLAALRRHGISVSAKLVVGSFSEAELRNSIQWITANQLPLYDVWVLSADDASAVARIVGDRAELHAPD